MPPDLIYELLSQTPQVQAKDLKTLAETINSSLKGINPHLLRVLEQSGKKEERNSGMEALERLLREGEIGKINPTITE
ncbi:MAG: hypothetical protein IMF11_02305 [Proteobacteria bacterium]|nr:hypothetical protein [Pseudomonadota bacterium]